MSNKIPGFAVLNGDAAELKQKTVLVLGVGRGGTSMVAGVLSKLGIYMGEGLNSRYQDGALLECINKGDKGGAKKIIAERNAQFPVWGIKKLNLWRWDDLFRQPVYVVIFRDVFATANRRVNLFNSPLLFEMGKILGLHFLLLLFMALSKRPTLVASYEKSLLYPDEFVEGLAAFLGMGDADSKADAIQFIKPSPTEYTTSPVNYRAARENRDYLGYIDQIEAKQISGWALSTLSTKPVSLELLINGIVIQNLSANLPRPDVKKADSRFHEDCGFVFKLSNELTSGDKIDIRFVGQDLSLVNSPQRFS